MQLQFLGWDWPLLEIAATHLLERFVENGRLDLRSVVLALPGSRAVQRLEELLLEKVEAEIEQGRVDSAWFPPRILTVGELPELLYPLQKPLADDLTQQLTWVAALDRMQKESPDILARVLPHPPDESDLSGRLSLGKLFAGLHRELAADVLDFRDVAEKCRSLGIANEAMRWDTLALLQENYHARIDALGLWDVQTARIFAIRNKEPKTDKMLVLVGTVDMNLAQKRILDLVSGNVISLVFAPELLKDRFDKYGCVVPRLWKEAPIPIAEERIEVVDTPADQANALALWLAKTVGGKYTAEEIVLGVPGEELVPHVQRQVRQAGIRTRYVAGIPISRTGPYRFLEIVRDWLRFRRFSDFADLLRHPQVPPFLEREGAIDTDRQPTDTAPPPIDTARLLIEADRYHTLFLPMSLEGDWREYVDPTLPEKSESFESLKQAKLKLEALLQPLFPAEKKRSRHWTEILSSVLQTVFGELRDEEHDSREGLDEIEKMLARIARLPERLELKWSAAETLELLLRQLQSVRIAPPADREALEIVGWLDLALDDAPVLVVTCLNEGVVPSSHTADLFLPDRIRQELEIEDNDRRLARDAYALSVILSTRPEPETVRLIAARRSEEGDPLLPSRLLFASDPETIARRVLRFFSVEERQAPVVFPGTIRSGRERSNFRPPQPRPLPKRVDSLRITEFRDYLACPYRYYLRHRLGLDVLHDRDEELDGAMFGNLAHEVLRRFGIGPLRDSTVGPQIAEYLDGQLTEVAANLYGENPRAVIAVQIEQLRHRLRAFANWQADWALAGNRIRFVELSLHERTEGGPQIRSFLDLGSGERIGLRGRIDRIDVNPRTNEWFLFDYKSSDTTLPPEKSHRKAGCWIDLQLPLYRDVIRRSFRDIPSLRVGYLVFPKDIAKTGSLLADWSEDDFENALATAREVARNIREEKFEPRLMPSVPPPFSEIYSPLCLDRY